MTTGIEGTGVSVDSSAALNDYIASQSKIEKASDQVSLWGDFDTFLTILTAQLKNQDPTEPVDASTFTQQLVQYAQVEQQIGTNEKLDEIHGVFNSNGITPLLGYVGQYVETNSPDKLIVQNGSGLMTYSLPQEALSVSISVVDESGESIATIDGTTSLGLNRISWDGMLNDGTKAKDGVYKYILTAKDNKDELIEVSDVRAIGQVSGVETDENGNISLKIGDYSLADIDIMSVFAAVGAEPSS